MTDRDEFVMGFGVHQGCPVCDVPDTYLKWVVRANRDEYVHGFWDADEWKPDNKHALAARVELKKRGYRFIGSDITKEEVRVERVRGNPHMAGAGAGGRFGMRRS